MKKRVKRREEQKPMTPYGYKIEQGHAVLDPDAAPKVKAFFRHYLDGLPVEPACIAAKVDRVRSC